MGDDLRFISREGRVISCAEKRFLRSLTTGKKEGNINIMIISNLKEETEINIFLVGNMSECSHKTGPIYMYYIFNEKSCP